MGGHYVRTKEIREKMRVATNAYFSNPKNRIRASRTMKRLGIKPPSRKNIPISPEQKIKISKALKGRQNNLWTKEAREKASKSAKKRRATIETKLKMSEAHKGSKCNLWKGGLSKCPYTEDWTRTLKRAIRERDNYICKICGEQQGKTTHDVHHIDYDKKNCDPKNLITLCHSCHSKTTFNRKKWKKFFVKKVGIQTTLQQDK
jgi:5-methylcytosine-specific restriction endonuclease McrA